MILYPQLPHAVAEHLAEERRSLTVPDAATLAYVDHPDAVFTPTGGSRASEGDLNRLRDALVIAASEHDYPGAADESARLRFDTSAACILHSSMALEPAEASKGGVWEFIACVLVCDLVRWRFPGGGDGTPIERFLAGRRNTFQRLWWRGYVLYDSTVEDPYWLVRSLGEDEIVQIMERPFLAGSRTLSRTVARELIAASRRHKHLARRVLIRETQKRVRRLAAFTSFEAIEEDELSKLIAAGFDAVAEAAVAHARPAG